MNFRKRFDTHELAAGLLLMLGLYVLYLIYLPGLSAALHFDTEVNLRSLESVRDLDSALRYIFSGIAGPLGRPISLASFIINAPAWPDELSDLIRTNICIHLINGALVAWASYLIVREYAGEVRKAAWIAVIAAILWLSAPILASTTYLVIQRMTSLAALFMLGGVVSHMHVRKLMDTRPAAGMVLTALSLVFFTLCAGLSKENGFLLPVLVLVLEAFLLKKPTAVSVRLWQAWKAVFLVAPLVLIIGYLATRWNYSEAVLLRRDFTAFERLMTQAVVLWEYLFHTAIPSIHRLGPFHDDHAVYRSLFSLPVAVSVGAWIAVMVVAWMKRNSWPMLAFAVFWFLGAHLVESTIVPLELYFEHRNYVALIGPFMALSYSVLNSPNNYRRILFGGLLAYLLLSLVILFRVNSFWGDPLKASDYWLEHNPQSLRANMHFAEQVVEQGFVEPAVEVLDTAADRLPEYDAYINLQSLYLRCGFNVVPIPTGEVKGIIETLPTTRFLPSLPAHLLNMLEYRKEANCIHYRAEDLFRMAETLLSNPGYEGNIEARHSLYSLMGHVRRDGEPEAAMTYYERALRSRHNPQLLADAVWLYRQEGAMERGCEFLDEMERFPPLNPFLRGIWLEGIDSYRKVLSDSRRDFTCEQLSDT